MKGYIYLLVALLLIPMFACTVESPQKPDPTSTQLTDSGEFTPVCRFVVCSDIHFEDGVTEERERFDKMCEIAYREAAADTKYTGLDAVCMCGDIANTGTVTQMMALKKAIDKNKKGNTVFAPIMGNHEFYGNGNCMSDFTEIFGFETKYSFEIEGYKFILITPDNSGSGYSATTIKWLDEELKKADKSKPVFVFQHHHILGTVYGSDCGWGVSDLTSTLSKYPNVVDFSGHSHFPINDPKSLWQGDFTALGTGTLSYYEMALGKTISIFPTGNKGEYTNSASHKDAAQFYIVEVDARGRLLIKMYDVLSDSYMCAPYFIENAVDKDKFEFTYEKKEEASVAPIFAEGTKAEVSDIKDTSAKVKIPQATQSGSDVVWYYTIIAKDNEGNTVFTGKLLSDYYYLPMTDHVVKKITGLEAGTEYTLNITAHNCYEKVSEPITVTFKTTGEYVPETSEIPQADIFDAVFSKDGLTNKVDGVVLSQTGSVSLSDGSATFNGGYFKYNDYEKWYPSMEKSVTMECYLSLDSFNSPYTNPFANMEAGGFGFEVTPEGLMQFYIMVNGTYYHPGYMIETGTYYHCVGTYDGKTIKLYIDGILRDSLDVAGKITWPGDKTARYLCVGTDSGQNGVGPTDAALHGGMKIARVYSQVLNKTQIKGLFDISTK